MAEIFGFEITRKKQEPERVSVVTPVPDDGATVVNNAAAYYGMVIDLEGVVKNENDLIRRYRESAQYCDCDKAIECIINDAIISDPGKPIVTLNMDDLPISDKIKNLIRAEFDYIKDLYKFEDKAHDIFRQWYIDGRLFYSMIINEANPANGIEELRFIDPRKIRRIKNVKREKNAQGIEVVKNVEEFFLYNDKGITEQTTQGVKLSVDSVVHATSGLKDSNTNMVLGYLHKAIKPVNQLKMMEDALVIYRISRAPERRIFYIDVGNLPKLRAEQYVNEMMLKFRNKVVYDATTGEIRDNRQHLSLMEDFWMPRREGGKGTEITTLKGGETLGQIEDIEYFQKKLYQALNVPLTRLLPDNGFNLGKASEITRDELMFNRFVARLRKRFCDIFKEPLRVQLIAKQIITSDDWEVLSPKIRFEFQEDNYFSELKQAEILGTRMQTLQAVDAYVGRYFSSAWIRKNVLHQTDEEIAQINVEMQYDLQLMQQQMEAEQGQQQEQQPQDKQQKQKK